MMMELVLSLVLAGKALITIYMLCLCLVCHGLYHGMSASGGVH